MSNLDAAAFIGMSGHYKLEVRGEDGEIKQVLEGDNVLTDQFLVWCAQNNGFQPESMWNVGFLSTNTSTPNAAATALTGVVANQSRSEPVYSTVGSGTDWWTYCTLTYAFPKNAYLGTFSSVGCGSTSGGGGLASWLRLVDGGGVSTSLTLVTNDQLTLTYIIKAKRPNAITTGSITLNSVNYDWTLWPCMISDNSINRWEQHPAMWTNGQYRDATTYSAISAPDVIVQPTGTFIQQISVQTPTSGGSVPYRDRVNFYDVNASNSNIKGMCASSGGDGGIPGNITATFICSFNNPIPKTNLQELTITFRYTYGRV